MFDGRTSRICRPLAGTVRPADDPWWNTHAPPLHYRCRTALVRYSETQAQQAGVTEKGPDAPPLQGFGKPPNLAQWEPNSAAYDPELWRAYAAQRPTGAGIIPSVEKQPRLDPQRLPGDERIPNDKLLRGASPVEVVGNAAGWLRDNFPTSKPAKYRIARDEKQLVKEAARWARRKGVDVEAVANELRGARAAHFSGELLVLPPTWELLGGGVLDRAKGFCTLAHEWWHLWRRAAGTYTPLEEGAAELFAERAVTQAIGIRPELAATLGSKTYRPYREAVLLLMERLGGWE